MSDPRHKHTFVPNRAGLCKVVLGTELCHLPQDAPPHARADYDAEVAGMERDRVEGLLREYTGEAPISGLFHPLRDKVEQVVAAAKREQMEVDLVLAKRLLRQALGLYPNAFEEAFRAAWAKDHPEDGR